MAHEEALSIVNGFQRQLSGLARSIVGALNDGKVSPWEGLAVGTQAMTTASMIMSLLQGVDPQVRKDILYVLENGRWSLEE
jgi:hypothetical protein